MWISHIWSIPNFIRSVSAGYQPGGPVAIMHLFYNYACSVFKLIFLGEVTQTDTFSKSNMHSKTHCEDTWKTWKQLATENDMERQGHTIKKKVQVLLCIAAVVHVNCQMCVWERERKKRKRKRERKREYAGAEPITQQSQTFMSFVSLWFARAKPGMRTNHDKVKNFVN